MFRNLLLSERNHPIRCLANWQLTTQTIQPSPGCGGRCAPRSMSMSWSRALVVARGGGGDGDTIDRLVTCNDYCKWRVFFPKEKKREEVMVKRWSLEFTVCFFFWKNEAPLGYFAAVQQDGSCHFSRAPCTRWCSNFWSWCLCRRRIASWGGSWMGFTMKNKSVSIGPQGKER